MRTQRSICPRPFLKADAAVQSAVERLADGIFFCPVDASRTGIVDIQLDAVQPISRIDAEDVLSAYGQRVFGDEGHVMAVVAHFLKLPVYSGIGGVILESGIRVAIAGVHRKIGGNCCGQGSSAPRLRLLPAFTVSRPKPLAPAKREICWSRVSSQKNAASVRRRLLKRFR